MTAIVGPAAPPPRSVSAANGADYALARVADSSDTNSVLFEHEEEIARDPFSVAAWCDYVRAAASFAPLARYAIYERAVRALPRSYKLWKLYLDEYYDAQARGQRIDAPGFATLAALYERALAQLPAMPRLWLDYTARLREMQLVTRTRMAFDRALRSLPITQHARIWPSYLAFVRSLGLPQLAVRVYRRYLQLEPAARQDYVTYLLSVSMFDEASRQLVQLIELSTTSAVPTPPHALWMQLCDVVTQHPADIAPQLDVDAILRQGIAQFTDEVGRLWVALATYYVRLGRFEHARDVYEEAAQSVVTVRDFSLVFDAYVKFIEAMLTAEMALAEAEADEEADEADDADEVDHQLQVDRLLKIYEDVADRRPLLLNAVLLRQNPHNVREWEKRAELLAPDATRVIRTFADAVKTVDPQKAGGRLHVLWIQFAKFYEAHDDVANARVVLERATRVPFRHEHELAAIYCEWAELELRADDFDAPLAILRGACAVPPTLAIHARAKTGLTAQDKVHRSVKLWRLRLDLEESLGDVASTRAAYSDAFELKVATPQMVLHFAAFLAERKYFEESFRAYERGLALFPKFPYANELWQTYLRQFVARYGGAKLERARDLFEQAIRAAPPQFAGALFTMYAAFEEQHGMLRNVMAIYERATDVVPPAEQLSMYAAYVKKAQTFFGVAKVRDVYARGIARLADDCVAPLCLEFAAMETKLGEIERARALYAHASQFCDPRQHEATFWSVWHAFEVAHGSEHSFLEMLRIKRSVVAQYAQVNYVASEIAPVISSDAPSTVVAGMVPASDAVTAAAAGSRSVDAMAALEADLVDASLDGDESSSDASKKRKLESDDATASARPTKHAAVVAVQNDEEIDLDDEDDDDDEEEVDDEDKQQPKSSRANGDGDVEQRALPATLFGSKLAQARE